MTIGLTEPIYYLCDKIAYMQNTTSFQDVLFDGNVLQIRSKGENSDTIYNIAKSCVESISYPFNTPKDSPVININLISGKTIAYNGAFDSLMKWFKS